MYVLYCYATNLFYFIFVRHCKPVPISDETHGRGSVHRSAFTVPGQKVVCGGRTHGYPDVPVTMPLVAA